MTDTAALRRVVDEAFTRLGRIDVVVSNAGYGLFGAAEVLTDEQINQQIATNLIGSIQLIRAALPHLRAQGGGRIAPFGIDFVIVEPGPTKTNFGAGLVQAKPLPDYAGKPADHVRHAITSGAFAIKGDAARTVDAMIAAADTRHPALRLTLGSTAYGSMSKALNERRQSLEAQREIACSADA
jgi:NAD(P)-dependent dehydrogenase (short-subunit alcohol dehydrogenase family)